VVLFRERPGHRSSDEGPRRSSVALELVGAGGAGGCRLGSARSGWRRRCLGCRVRSVRRAAVVLAGAGSGPLGPGGAGAASGVGCVRSGEQRWCWRVPARVRSVRVAQALPRVSGAFGPVSSGGAGGCRLGSARCGWRRRCPSFVGCDPGGVGDGEPVQEPATAPPAINLRRDSLASRILLDPLPAGPGSDRGAAASRWRGWLGGDPARPRWTQRRSKPEVLRLVRRLDQRRRSRCAAGNSAIAMASFTASPSRNGVTPIATASAGPTDSTIASTVAPSA
jgi:hypothetical protein